MWRVDKWRFLAARLRTSEGLLCFEQIDEDEMRPFAKGEFGNLLDLLLLDCLAVTTLIIGCIKFALVDLEGLVDELVYAEQ